MNVIKFAFSILLLFGGYQWWKKHHSEVISEGAFTLVAGETGFVRMPQPMGTDAGTVLIFAPANCPSDAAQRARSLSRELAARRIPHVELDEASFDMDNPDQKAMATIKRVMEGIGPTVFVGGKGKANPALAEVVAEYEASRR